MMRLRSSNYLIVTSLMHDTLIISSRSNIADPPGYVGSKDVASRGNVCSDLLVFMNGTIDTSCG